MRLDSQSAALLRNVPPPKLRRHSIFFVVIILKLNLADLAEFSIAYLDGLFLAKSVLEVRLGSLGKVSPVQRLGL